MKKKVSAENPQKNMFRQQRPPQLTNVSSLQRHKLLQWEQQSTQVKTQKYSARKYDFD